MAEQRIHPIRLRHPILRVTIRLALAVAALTGWGVHAKASTTQPSTQRVPLGPGEHQRYLMSGGRWRSYRVHVPPTYDPKRPTPVVLAYHGALMNAAQMELFTRLNAKADRAGFVAVYPNGTGIGQSALFFNASAAPRPQGPPDDVRFTADLLDDLATVVAVDPKRVFATGMSNGGMMCHRVAAELADRIAAIAPVGGTLALPAIHPARPVPVILFHGTADQIVPFDGPRAQPPLTMRFRSVADTVKAWVEADGCPPTPTVSELPILVNDGTRVTRHVYGPGTNGAEVVEIVVTNGGHTWPGQPPPVKFIGPSTMNASANDLMWDFFVAHPMR